jgi:uncharacterized protein
MWIAMREGKKKRNAVKSIVSIILSAFALYLIIVASLYMIQETMVFHPRGLSSPVPATVNGKSVENIEIPVAGSTHVRGWFRKAGQGEKQKLVIYFGGNAEEISYLLNDSSFCEGWSLALTNYRGYGQSDGKPGEQALFEDSIKIYDYYMNRGDIDKNRVVVMGRSLGTGVATFLASRRPARAVILVSPFGSIADVAREQFPFVPIDLILKHRFDSYLYAPAVKAPLLCILGSVDTTIPPAHSLKLAGKWGGPSEIHELTGFGHNDLMGSKEARQLIAQFLERME